MPSYASLVELKQQSLTQYLLDPAPPDTALTARLDQAEAMINAYLGLDASIAAAAVSTRTIYGNGTLMLELPLHTAGSVTTITTLAGYTVPFYAQRDAHLVITDSTGLVVDFPSTGLAAPYFFEAFNTWRSAIPYTVTAAWGASAATMHILRAVTLDVAVQLWRYRDAGGSETIGAEGGVTTVRSGLTALHKLSLDGVRARMNQNVGIY